MRKLTTKSLSRISVALLVFVTICSEVRSEDSPVPYKKTAVGDWLKYHVRVKSSLSPFEYFSLIRVTHIDGDTVTITQQTNTRPEQQFQDNKTSTRKLDLSQPVPLLDLLGYEEPHELRMKNVEQGRSNQSVKAKELMTQWFRYDVGRGTPYPAEKVVWVSEDVPLEGIVRRETAIKGLSSSEYTEVLLAFGTASDALPPDIPDDPGAADSATSAVEKEANSLQMELLRIKGGVFSMGAMPQNDFLLLSMDAKSREEKTELLLARPPFRTAIVTQDYWIASKEVTVAQFRKFVSDSGYITDAEKDKQGGTGLLANGSFGQSPKFTWKELGFPLKENYPVVNVSWHDAQAFCEWLSRSEKCAYRLPTEAEWEHACRAGSTTTFCCGDSVEDLSGFANVADQSLLEAEPKLPWPALFRDGAAYLAEVGGHRPNDFGIYDMHGNAMEWCQSRFSISDPLEHLAPPPASAEMYCLRGGNWFNQPDHCGSACRTGAVPQTRMSLIGFRVVRQVAE